MDGKPGLFHLLGQRMDWLGQRQKVLAQNIANADTPDYVPHDLKPQEFRRMVDVEAELIRATLEATGGKRGEAARMLGIPRRTFYNRLKALGIE